MPMLIFLQNFWPPPTLDEYEYELEHEIMLSWMRDFHARTGIPSLRN
jgi:hypothetical protein